MNRSSKKGVEAPLNDDQFQGESLNLTQSDLFNCFQEMDAMAASLPHAVASNRFRP